MRLAVLLPLVAACAADSYGALSIDPPDGPPLGVGLVQQFTVMQVFCEGGVDGSCDPTNPPQISVSISSGDAIQIIDVGSDVGTFDVAGLAAGSATVEITGGDGVSFQHTIDVAPVAQTTLSVPRDTGYSLHSPVQTFGKAYITIDQQNLGAGGTALAGKAPLQATSGLAVVAGDIVELQATAGSVQVTAAAATLELDIVPDSALASFSIDGNAVDELVLYTSTGTQHVSLLATDASGQPIAGGGPDPTLVIGDARVFSVTGGSSLGNTRTLDIDPIAAGNSTLQVTWGQVTKTFAISVIAG